MKFFYKNVNTPKQKCYAFLSPPYSIIEVPAASGYGPRQQVVFYLYQQRLRKLSRAGNIAIDNLHEATRAGMAAKWLKKVP